MALFDTGIGSSSNLFHEIYNDRQGNIVVSSLLILVGLLLIYLFQQHYPYWSLKKRLAPGAIIILGAFIVFESCSEIAKLVRIYKNHQEARAVTLNIEYYKNYYTITYRFAVGDKLYEGTAQDDENPSVSSDVIVPKGVYKVIYNKEDPEESVIDFEAALDKR